MNHILYAAGERLLRLLYPPRCPVCDRLLERGFFFCPECREKLPLIQGGRCEKCGKSVPEGESLCRDCRLFRHSYDEGMGLCTYDETMKKILYALKYKNQKEYGISLGHFMSDNAGDLLSLWQIDALVPVPVHKSRLRERGYNQAEVIAGVLAEEKGLPLLRRAVIRTGKTRAMKNLDREERRENMRHAFDAGEDPVRGRHILIVDDIYTTGSTIDAVAEILFREGASSVSFLSVCIGGRNMI